MDEEINAHTSPGDAIVQVLDGEAQPILNTQGIWNIDFTIFLFWPYRIGGGVLITPGIDSDVGI